MAKPSHWPPNLQYIENCAYHSSVCSSTRSFIQGSSTELSRNCRPPVVIRPLSSPSHPACGQYGLFAAKKIPPRTHILDYIGEIHCDDRLASDYDLSLYRSLDGLNIGVDASVMGNEARFINDFRGIRDKPNAIFSDGRIAGGQLRMSIWSTNEAIKKGDEILVSYGKSWWKARTDNDKFCR
jgi:Proteins containing SET domain